MLIKSDKVAKYANDNPSSAINTIPKLLVGIVFTGALALAFVTSWMIVVNI